ncbi:MAG TPA: hypothetical protein VN838_07640, partial [Bradyrhizobium sp.]|nr:hypothetical protein [Bradyrhizobium sp.]
MNESTNKSDELANQEFQAKWQQVTDRLIFARAAAIDSYAAVEQQLMNVFSTLLDIDQDVGSLVFYRVVNARSRNAMIQDLVIKKHGQTYKR